MNKNKFSRNVMLILYPVFLYFVVSLFVMCVLELLIGNAENYYVIRQTIGAVITIPFMRKMYRMDILLRNIRPLEYSGKERSIRYLHAMITAGFAGIAFNNLIGMTSLQEMSGVYQELTDSFYAGTFVIELVGLGIVIPFAEELLYRGVVYGRLKDWLGVHQGMILSALIFGLVHLNLVQFIYAFFMGLILAWFTEKYNSFIPAFLGHAAANIVSILRQELGIFDFMEKSTGIFLLWTIIMSAISLSLFFLQFRVKTLE